MGGSGSGNHYHGWRQSKKTTVEDCLSIDANHWQREGILKAKICQTGSCRWTYRSGNRFTVNYQVVTLDLACPFVRLWYSWTRTSTRQSESAEYSVPLSATRPRFGGLRWWFICPLIVKGRTCGRRVGKLHLPPGARYFGCRQCHSLTYTSCQESHKYDRLYRFMAKNLGWDIDAVKRMMGRIGKRR